MSSFNFLYCVGIASDQRMLFIRHAVAAKAGHDTIHQPVVWGIHGKNIEYSGTYDTAMHLDYIFIIRHGTSSNAQDSAPLGSSI